MRLASFSSIVIFLALRITSVLSGPLDLPGDGASFAFGEATRADSKGAYIELDSAGSRVPKGIYHYTERVTGAEGGWKLPGAGEWGATDVMLSDATSSMDGFSINPSILSDPINVQLLTERKVERGLSGAASPDESSALLAKARSICAPELTADCEEALRTYYEAKARQVAFERMPLYRKLVDLGESARATVKGRDSRSLGVLLDLPGQKPLYMGASLDNGGNRDLRIRVNPN